MNQHFALDLTGFVWTFVLIAAFAALLLVTVVTVELVHHHALRVGRRESIPRYYGRLAFSH